MSMVLLILISDEDTAIVGSPPKASPPHPSMPTLMDQMVRLNIRLNEH